MTLLRFPLPTAADRMLRPAGSIMEERPNIDLGNLDRINNIETARMALRWALERLHVLEAAKAESSDRSTREAKWRSEAEDEVRRLKATLAIKTTQHEERERYYKRIEEFLSLRLAGQIDVAALAKRETDLDRLREDLEGRVVQLEREFAARRQSLELEYQRLNREAREAAQAGAQDAQVFLHKRQEDWEKDHATKLVDLKERELRIAKQESELGERQRRADEYAQAQKARLESQAREQEDQVQARLRTAERILEERRSAQESGWTREKALLLQEIALLRRQVQEQTPALLEADRRAEEAAQALTLSQEAQRRAEQKARLADLDRQAGIERLKELEGQHEAELGRRSELERRLSAAQAEGRAAESTLAEERLALVDRERELAHERESFRLSELEKDAPQRLAELRRDFEARLEAAETRFKRETGELVAQLQERDERLARQVIEHERDLEEQRARLSAEFDERLKGRDDQTAAWERMRIDEAAQWRRRLEEALAKSAELEGELSAAGNRVQVAEEKAQAEAERRQAMAEHDALSQGLWRQEWEAERRSLLAKIAELEGAVRKAREEGEAQTRVVAADAQAERLGLEERHRREIEAARQAQSSWDEAHVREASEWRGRTEEANAKILALEEHLAQAAMAARETQELERRAKEAQADAARRVDEAKVHHEDMMRRMEEDRQRERQDFERLLSEGDQKEARLLEELRATKLALEDNERRRNDEQTEHRLRLKQDLDEAWKARLAGEEALAEKARAALERVSELERVLAENESIVRHAQQVLADDAERHQRLLQEAAEMKGRYEEEVAALRQGIQEREAAVRQAVQDREAAIQRQFHAAMADDAARYQRLVEEAEATRQRYEQEAAALRAAIKDRESAVQRAYQEQEARLVGSLEQREAALLGSLAEREAALTRRATEVEAAASRAATEYRERRDELERLKVELERRVTELVRKAQGG